MSVEAMHEPVPDALFITSLARPALPSSWRASVAEGRPLRARLRAFGRALSARAALEIVTRESWLEVRADEETAEEVIDEALEQGLSIIDPTANELVAPASLRATGVLRDALELLVSMRSGYLVIEGGPALAFYVQAFVDEDARWMEAVAGRHLRGFRPRHGTSALRLLGFRPDPDGRPNLVRPLDDALEVSAHVLARALADVYGVGLDAPLRLRLAETH
jgi:hypothetical protein